MPTHLRSNNARRRAELVSDGVTASYIHEITRPVRRAGAVRPVAAPARLRPRSRPVSRSRRTIATAPVAV